MMNNQIKESLQRIHNDLDDLNKEFDTWIEMWWADTLEFITKK